MKKLITIAAAIILTGGLSSFAAGKNPTEISKKQIAYEMSFSKIVVDNDLDVSLTESTDRTMEVSGTEADIAKVDWKIKNNVLYLKSKRGTSLKNKIKVNVFVFQLSEIVIKGESTIRSTSRLTSPELNVVIDGNGFASIINTGSILVQNAEGTQLEVQRKVGDVVVKS